jgi:hypothetical protein
MRIEHATNSYGIQFQMGSYSPFNGVHTQIHTNKHTLILDTNTKIIVTLIVLTAAAS